jgi:hypothetical protein
MGGFGQQQPVLGMPQPNWNPMGSRNPDINMAFAQYAPALLPQFFGGGKFLPQQFPAQNVMDQMISAKYNMAARQNEVAARRIDQGTVFEKLKGIRSQFDQSELSELGAKQLDNTASLVNSQFAQDMAGMLLGPQVAEDLFFGRKGSAVQLARQTNRIGFSRTDPVTAAGKMSGESLEQFSTQIYDNLYGNGADFNDVSGFSAGRVGSVMSELHQRGMLPTSMRNLSGAEQRKTMQRIAADEDIGLSQDMKDKIAGTGKYDGQGAASVEELSKTEEGATAVRKIDATRVSNSLKGYTKALSAVREIFGDNGITNAPMQQLMAAMDAISQNGGSTMAPGKLENLMRRTQIASRDSGVSLEALMGLQARSGAIADQYGLSREMAGESVITAMNTGQALKNTGGFTPGFGRMDSTKATMFALDQSLRTDASTIGKFSGGLARIVAENEGRRDFTGTRMRSFVGALQRGENTFFDEELDRVVNIHEEMGKNPDAFVGGMLEQAGISKSHFGALLNDKGTQEYQRSIAGSLVGAQAHEMKQAMGANIAFNTDVMSRIGGGVDEKDKQALAISLGRGLSTALIDDVDTTMNATERLDVLNNAMTESVVEFVQQTNPGLSADEVRAKAAEMTALGDKNVFGLKTEQDRQNFLSQRYAESGTYTEAQFGTPLSVLQQNLNARTRAEEQRIRKAGVVRAGLDSNMGLSDGSNFLQRVSDAIGGDSSKPLLEQMFGVIDSAKDREKLTENIAGGKKALEGAFGDIQTFYQNSVVDTEDEKKKLLGTLRSGDAGAGTVTDFKARFEGTAGAAELADKKTYMSNAEVASAITTAATDGKDASLSNRLARAYQTQINGDMKLADLQEVFKKPNSEKAQAYIKELASSAAGLEAIGAVKGIDNTVLTEAQASRVNSRYDAYGDKADRARVNAAGQLFRELNSGQVRSQTILGSLGANETAIKHKGLNDVIGQYIENKGGSDNEIKTQLAEAGVGGEMADKVLTMAQFSRNLNAISYGTGMSGLDMASAQTRTEIASRETALQKAVEEGKVGGKLAEAVKTTQSKDTKVSAEDRDKAQAYINETIRDDKTFKARLADQEASGTLEETTKRKSADGKSDVKYERLSERADDVTQKGKEILGDVSASKDPTGIGGAIAGSIGPAIGDAIKSAMGGEIKFENVTISNLNVAKLGAEVGGAKVTAASSGGGGGQMEITGEVSLKNLFTALVKFVGKRPTMEAVPNGPTVVADNVTDA